MARRAASSFLSGLTSRAASRESASFQARFQFRQFTVSSDKERVPLKAPAAEAPIALKSFKSGKTTYAYNLNTRPIERESNEEIRKLMGDPLQEPAGVLWGSDIYDDDSSPTGGGNPDESTSSKSTRTHSNSFIPEVALFSGDGREKRRILILCTGGTLTMAPDPNHGGSLVPVEGAISSYMQQMNELQEAIMPDFVLHEYSPFRDSSDLGPADWKTLANDIKANYLQFDGFVILTGTDTMAYCATALSFMLENLGKPVIFTGFQIPLCEPYNDARRNLIMAMIFASRDSINEVSIYFHDRLLRANRTTKINTDGLLAFDSPNMDPLAKIGISIEENDSVILPPPKGALRVHSRMDTRLLTIRLVPGFDDGMLRTLIESSISSSTNERRLRSLVLQLYGTGNAPSVKESFIQLLADARDRGVLVVATSQCQHGSVRLGHYAVGRALAEAGVVSANDMTIEATACKCAYLFGRQDLTDDEVAALMSVPLRGEVTPTEMLGLPVSGQSSAFKYAARNATRHR